MNRRGLDYGLEFLLAFDERVHHLEKGYSLKFEIRRVETSKNRSHGLSYSFTLHAPDGTRLVGFDPDRPYRFKDAETLIDDFFNEVERVLHDRGVGLEVLRTE